MFFCGYQQYWLVFPFEQLNLELMFIIIYSEFSQRIKSILFAMNQDIRFTQGSQPETGKKVKNYIYHYADKIGSGNFAKVFKGLNVLTNETVAIKLISLDELKCQRLEALVFEQIRVLQQFSHPNILRFIEAMLSERNCYIVTELCREGNLDDRIKTRQPFSDQELSTIIVDLWKGLKYMREKGVTHRDLKPANIFISNGRMKIADFGLAKFYKERFQDLDIGSPQYMSPEGMILNCYSEKTDIWSFGIILYELLHGVTPFLYCRDENQMKYRITRPIPENMWRKDINPMLRRLINSMLEVDEYKRPSIDQLTQEPYLRELLVREGIIQEQGRPYTNSYHHPQMFSQGNIRLQESPQHNQHLTPPQWRGGIMQEGVISPKSKSMNNKISLSNFNSSPSKNSLENSLHVSQNYNKPQEESGEKDHIRYSFSKKDRENPVIREIMVKNQFVSPVIDTRPGSSHSPQINGNYCIGEPVSPLLNQQMNNISNQPYLVQPGIKILTHPEYQELSYGTLETNESEDERRSPKRILYPVKRGFE